MEVEPIRRFQLIVPMLLAALLAGCTNDNSYISDPAAVNVESPFTISRNSLFQAAGKPGVLSLELVQGTYREDWNAPSPFAGRSWSGQFRLSISADDGRLLHTFPLSDQYNEELVFNDLFLIEFGDYNSDGNPDFTIGQYGSSNGNVFKLFTISEDYSIKELPVDSTPELFITVPERYSVKLDETADGFKTAFYDNSLGRQVVNTYRWNAFKKVKQLIQQKEVDG